jgi:hypothetical protein
MVQWAVNGLPVCTAVQDQIDPTITSDGNGGVIVAWEDSRSGTPDIYAQSINSSGVVQWAANGIVICDAANLQELPDIVSDSIGGATITWRDNRIGSWDIYAQKVNSGGLTQWSFNGITICNASSFQFNPTIVSDNSGGNIIAWCDLRAFPQYNFYTQRIDAAGTPLWTLNGVQLALDTNYEDKPIIVSDGNNGAIIAWPDYRAGSYDLYARK